MKTVLFRLRVNGEVEIDLGASDVWVANADYEPLRPARTALESSAVVRGSELGFSDGRARKVLMRAQRMGLAHPLLEPVPAG